MLLFYQTTIIVNQCLEILWHLSVKRLKVFTVLFAVGTEVSPKSEFLTFKIGYSQLRVTKKVTTLTKEKRGSYAR